MFWAFGVDLVGVGSYMVFLLRVREFSFCGIIEYSEVFKLVIFERLVLFWVEGRRKI